MRPTAPCSADITGSYTGDQTQSSTCGGNGVEHPTYRRGTVYAISTRNLRKEFRYLNPNSNMATSDQWFEYIVSFITGKNRSGLGVEKRRIVAVDSLDLNIYEREFFGLLGPNGAGKTTSIKMLSTILAPTSGTAIVNGYDLVKQINEAKASINVVQSGGWLGFDHKVSIRWNLSVWARIYGMSKREAALRTEEVLGLVGLQDRAEESSGTLSSGERQRLALAKGFLIEAPILLCDEPTTALDPYSAHSVRRFIKDELNRRRGQTVLLTTHNMNEADQLCDRVAIMDKGRVVACGTPNELKSLAGAKALLFEVAHLTIQALNDFRAAHPDWHITEKLDQGGSGSLRVLYPAQDDERDVLAAVSGIRECGAEVKSWAEDSVTLEDSFLRLTGKRLQS